MVLVRPTIVVNIRTATVVVDQAAREGRFVEIFRGTPWGNPFSHLPRSAAKWRVSSREEAIARYEPWLLAQPDLVARLPTLKGCVLGCWCMPQACHGLVLARLADAA